MNTVGTRIIRILRRVTALVVVIPAAIVIAANTTSERRGRRPIIEANSAANKGATGLVGVSTVPGRWRVVHARLIIAASRIVLCERNVGRKERGESKGSDRDF